MPTVHWLIGVDMGADMANQGGLEYAPTLNDDISIPTMAVCLPLLNAIGILIMATYHHLVMVVTVDVVLLCKQASLS
jgi:hypothetical protein